MIDYQYMSLDQMYKIKWKKYLMRYWNHQKEQDVTEVQTTINSILKKFNDIDPKVLLEQDESENKLVKWFRKKLNKYQEN